MPFANPSAHVGGFADVQLKKSRMTVDSGGVVQVDWESLRIDRSTYDRHIFESADKVPQPSTACPERSPEPCTRIGVEERGAEVDRLGVECERRTATSA